MKKLIIPLITLFFLISGLSAQVNPGNALSFDGTNDYIDLPSAVYFNGQYSIECWVYPRSYGHYPRVIDFGNGVSSDNIILILNDPTNNCPLLSVYPGNYLLTAPKPLELNKWSHIAVTVGADKAKMYINGNIVAVDDASNYLASNVVRNDCYIARSNWTGDDYSDAMFDELRIWNTTRTQQQIIDNMHQSLSGSEFGLEAYYIFNHSTGTTLMDISDEPYYDGTLYNMDNNDWVVSNAMIQPIIKPATNIYETSFTVNWHAIEGANMYIDVSTHVDFDTLDILDNQNLGVVNASVISGLDTATTYYYRVKSETNVMSDFSETGMVTTKGRPSGKCIDFDGVNDYVDLGDFSLPDNYSIEFWAKPANPNTTGKDYIIGKHGYNGSNQFLIGYESSRMQIYNGSDAIYIDNHFQTTDWYHFAAVFQEKADNTTEIKVYKNGKLIKDEVLNSVTGDLIGKHWVLAQEWDATPSDFYPGKLDEVRFWGKALTQADIKRNMYHELDGSETGLVAYYDFNSIHGQFTPDLAGNAYHGHIIGIDNIVSQWMEADAMITPTAREASPISDTSFTAHWDIVPPATKYYIEVSDINDFSNIIVNDSTTTDTSYLVTGLTPGSNYYYRIKSHAYNKTIESNVVEVNTLMSPPGNALVFDGADDYVQFDSPMDNESFTFEAWIKPGDKVGRRMIFSTKYLGCGDPSSSGASRGLCLHINKWSSGHNDNSRLLAVELSDGTSGCKGGKTYEGLVPVDEWVHVALTIGGGVQKLYFNGDVVQTYEYTDRWLGYYNMRVGNSQYESGRHYEGQMDEIRIWHAARTEVQINASMHKTLTGKETGLFAYYNCDMVAGNILPDVSLNNNYGALMNMSAANWVDSRAVIRPFAREASNLNHPDFTANWDGVPLAEKYYLQVATDVDFSNIVLFDSTVNNAYDVNFSPDAGLSFYYRIWCKAGRKYSDTSNTTTLMFNPGNALAFDGMDDHVRISKNEVLDLGNNFSVSLWIKPGTGYGSEESGHIDIISRWGAGGEGYASYLIGLNSAGNVLFHTFDSISNTSRITGDKKIKENQWSSIVCTFNEGVAAIYVNGVLDKEVNDVFAPQKSVYDLFIGQEVTGGNNYKGIIDEVCFYNYALTENQVLNKIHHFPNKEENGLIAYFDFNMSAGTVLKDLTGNTQNGVLTNMNDNDWVESSAVIIPFAREATSLNHPNFTANWDSIPSAEKYYLQVAADDDFSNIVLFDSTINNAYDVSFSPYAGASFYYRVWCKTVKVSDTSNVMPVLFPPGNAVLMENTFDGIESPHHDSTNFGDGPFTIELWFKNYNTGVSSHERLVTKRGAAERWYSFLIYNNKLGIELSNNPSTRLTTGVGRDINGDGLWHHAAVVRNDTSAVYLYLDGMPYYVGDFPYTIDNTEMLEIGKWTTEAHGGETFYGKMDEIRMWNVARTHQEINQYRYKELTGDENGLVLYYNMDHYQDTIVYDQSKNKINGSFNQLDASAWIPSRALITPVAREAANVTMGSFTANWDSVDLAQKYYIQVSDKAYFSTLIVNDSTINAHYEVSGLTGNNYYYRVMALANRLSDTSNVIDVYFTPGNALAFDGVNDYAADEIYYNQLNTSQFSYTAWAKVTGNDNNYRAVFSNRGSEPYKGVTLYASASNKWQLLIGDASLWYSIFSPDIIVNDQWYYIACTYDGMTLKLFVNGDLVAQTQVSNYVVNPDQPFSIGKVSESNNYYFNGLIDEVTVWDRPLTEQEVNEIMHQQVSVDENGLLAYYNFDETNAAKVYDQTWTPFFFDLPLHNMDPATDWIESHALITPFARKATQLTTNGFVANWDSIPNAIEYTIEISDKEDFSNIIVNETMDSNSCQVTGIDEGTVLYYRVKAKTDKESDYSNTVRVNVPMVVPGNALSFNGTNQRIDAHNVSTENFRRGLTVEAWIKTPDNTHHTKFLGFFSSGGGNRNLLNIEAKKLAYWDDSKGYITSPNSDDTLANNTWYHVAMVIEPNNNCYVYQDGDIMASFTTSVLPLTDGKFTIGCDWDGASTNNFFNGMMDELRIWDYPRSREELQNNMHNTIAPDENGLVAYYHFDNYSGNTLYDLTSNKYHGTMISMNDNNWQPSMAIIQPTAREATGVTYSSFVAHWDTVPSVTDYILDITTDQTFDTLDIIDSVLLNQTHYLADTLKQSTDYFYRIRYFKDTLSAYSNVVKVATAARKPRIINDSITDICDYDTLILQSNYMINNEYQWFYNDTAIPGANKDHYFIDTSGTYKFMAIDTLWQDTAWSDPVAITIHTSQFGTAFTASDTILNSPNFESYKFRVNFTNNTPHMSQYQYNWDFGDDSTTHVTDPVHSYLFNGKYTVALTVIDTTTMCMQKVEKPEYIVCKGGIDNIENGIIVTGNTTICPGDSVKLACQENNADVYQWRKGGTNITNANDSILYATEAGTYSCMLTLTGIATEETEQINIDTFNLIEPVIVTDGTLDACMTDSVALSLDTTYNKYNWSTGDSLMQISVDQPDDYRVTVVDDNGCRLISDIYNLEYTYVPIPRICMVTVDTSDNGNLVVWDKIADGRVAGYRIYKEQNADNNFVLMDSVMQNELTVWVDTASDPRVNAERYKISAFDTCGNETAMSDYHKTIHLQINAGTQGERNLSWDDYEIGDYDMGNNRVVSSVAFDEGSYFVFRGTSPDDLQLYTTRPAGTKTWSDFDTSEVYYYRVAAIKADTCDPAGLLKASAGPFSQSVSNLEDNRLKGSDISDVDDVFSLDVYPNPYKKNVNILYTLNNAAQVIVEIYNPIGEKLKVIVNDNQNAGSYRFIFNPESLGFPKGIYYLRMNVDGRQALKKLIYQ